MFTVFLPPVLLRTTIQNLFSFYVMKSHKNWILLQAHICSFIPNCVWQCDWRRQMQPVCQESSLALAQWARLAGGKLIFDECFIRLSYTDKLTLMVGVMLPGRDLLSRDLRVPLSPETGGWSCSWCLSSWKGEGWGKAFIDPPPTVGAVALACRHSADRRNCLCFLLFSTDKVFILPQ